MSRKIQNRLRAQHLDRAVVAMSSVFVQQIHLSIQFEERIDADRMARALRLCMDAEPVLGCRYVDRWVCPYWKRLPDEQLDRFSALQVTQGDEDANQAELDRFLARLVPYGEQPQLEALLLRYESFDRVIIKVNHQVVDAGGTKALGYLVAKMYRELSSNEDYHPVPNPGTRSIWQVYWKVLPRHFFRLLWLNAKENYRNSVPYLSIRYPSGLEKKGVPVFLFKRFGTDRVQSLKDYGKERGATINDVVSTALTRAYIRNTGWDGEGQLRMTGTVDLRRYLPEKQGMALCNLSSFYFANLGLDPGKSFDETLAKTKQRIDHAKRNLIGLPFSFGSVLLAAPMPEFYVKWLIARFLNYGGIKGNIPPSMTNLGPIVKEHLDFGSTQVSAAEVVVPTACPPFFVVGVSGYNGTLTFSTGFYESAVPKRKAEELFEFLDEELPG